MRVRAEEREYKHTAEGKPRTSRGYALVTEHGKPLFVGLFATEEAAAKFCTARGWRLVKEPS